MSNTDPRKTGINTYACEGLAMSVCYKIPAIFLLLVNAVQFLSAIEEGTTSTYKGKYTLPFENFIFRNGQPDHDDDYSNFVEIAIT